MARMRSSGLGPDATAEDVAAYLWRKIGPPFPVYSVYLFYDVEGNLLYVGATGQREQRSHQHANSAPWWHLVARAEYEHFHGPGAKEKAFAAERALIAELRPYFNVVGNPGDRSI